MYKICRAKGGQKPTVLVDFCEDVDVRARFTAVYFGDRFVPILRSRVHRVKLCAHFRRREVVMVRVSYCNYYQSGFAAYHP